MYTYILLKPLENNHIQRNFSCTYYRWRQTRFHRSKNKDGGNSDARDVTKNIMIVQNPAHSNTEQSSTLTKTRRFQNKVLGHMT